MYKTLIVVDSETSLPEESLSGVITFDSYLREYPKLSEPRTRIINLCNTDEYLSKGYYCSLLAEAREHRALPSVKTINELRGSSLSVESLLTPAQRSELYTYLNDQGELLIFFGKCEVAAFRKLCSRLFSTYPSPILKLQLRRETTPFPVELVHSSFSSLSREQQKEFHRQLHEFTRTVWRIGRQRKQYRWDMAILVNHSEKVPPSNREAISKFVKAAAKQGINAEVLTAEELTTVTRYDALFIRETTAIDHHTYRLVTQAEREGLVVMDDSTSILRCCNKVYLHDAFTYQNVPSLKTSVIANSSEETLNMIETEYGYPLVLKMPEGSFSKGVFKVSNREELVEKLGDLFSVSALVLAQEYLYTEYDWRIGILNNRAIYACRYLMARNHWQIYNHGAKRFFSGDFETVPTFEVPRAVLDAALKAAKIIGTGLYGVDVKELNNKAYVLEVNDNPSIDHKVEDAYLGDELYMQIMSEFQRRLEQRGR